MANMTRTSAGDSRPIPPDNSNRPEAEVINLQRARSYVCRAERGKARAGNLWHPLVFRIGNNMQQFRDPFYARLARQCRTTQVALGSI
jgi:hypothetical protein